MRLLWIFDSCCRPVATISLPHAADIEVVKAPPVGTSSRGCLSICVGFCVVLLFLRGVAVVQTMVAVLVRDLQTCGSAISIIANGGQFGF